MSDTTEKKVLIDVQLSVNQAIKAMADAQLGIKNLRDENKELSKDYATNSEAIAVNNVQIKNLQASNLASQKIALAETAVIKDSTGAYNKLNLQYAVSAQKAKDLGAAVAMGDTSLVNASKKASKEANDLAEKLKGIDKGVGQNQRSIGDYANAMQGLPGIFGKIAGGAETGTTAMKAFNLTNPLGWIMLLVGAVSGWVSIMNKNADFAKGWQKLMAGISAVFESLSGYVIKGTMAISDFFKGIKDFPDFLSKVGSAIKENIVNHFTAIGVIGKAISELFSGNWKAAVKDFTNGAIQGMTGFANVTDAVGKVVADVAEKSKKAMDWGALLVDNEKKLAKMNTNATEQLARLEVIIEEGQAKIGKLGTMGATRDEREAAYKIVEDAEKKKIALETDIANQELKISKLKRDKQKADTGANTNDVLQEVATKNAALIKLEGELELKLKEIKMRRVKADAQFLTESITLIQNNAKTEKTIEEEKLKQSDLSIEEKQKSIDKIHQIDNDSYSDQIKAITDFSKKKIDFDALMNESDSNKALQMIKNSGLTKTAETELIKILNDRKTNLIQTNKDEIQFNKERANQLVSDLQNELQLHQLYDKELNAGTQLSHQQEINELVNTYNVEQKELDAKHEAGLISEEQYNNAQKLLDQKFNTDKAVSDASYEQKKRSLKAAQLSNELTDLIGNFDLENSLKHQQLDAQMIEELRVADLTEQQKKIIIEKYARESVSLDLETTKQKVDNVLKYANEIEGIFSKIDAYQKQIEAGQLQDAEDANTKKIADLDDRLAKGLISQKQHDDGVAKSTSELDKKKAKITHDDAVREKELNIFKTIINTASAIVEALPNIPLSILAGVTGAVELATIVATPIPKAATGGLITGNSHAQGGVLIEAEGGETVINKKATSMFGGILSLINGVGNGKNVEFQNQLSTAINSLQGGNSTFSHSPLFSNDGGYQNRMAQNYGGVTKQDIEDAMTKAVSKVKVISTIEDIRKADVQYSKIEDRGSH